VSVLGVLGLKVVCRLVNALDLLFCDFLLTVQNEELDRVIGEVGQLHNHLDKVEDDGHSKD
jgi:hypothetical protein